MKEEEEKEYIVDFLRKFFFVFERLSTSNTIPPHPPAHTQAPHQQK